MSSTPTLRSMRLTLGWSQADMAKRLDKSLRQYRAWEKGEYPVPVVVTLAVERLAGTQQDLPGGFICVIRKYLYGTSGNELPPPVVKTEESVIVNRQGETGNQFKARMQVLGMSLRNKYKAMPRPDYGEQPGCGWEILPVIMWPDVRGEIGAP